MRTTKFLAAAAAASLLAVPGVAAADGHGAMVTVVHGIPDTPVDIYVNGEEAIPDFAYKTITDPIMFEAGDYEIDIFLDGEGPDGTPVLELDTPLADGDNLAVVAHLDADSAPTLSAFVNDVSSSDEGARVTVRHTAAAPAVSIETEGTTLIEEFSNGTEGGPLDVAAGTYNLDIAAGGEVVFPIGDTELAEGVNTVVYAVGVFPDTFELLVDSYQLEAEGASNGGEAGLSTDSSGIALTAAGLLLLAGAALGLRRRATDTV